MSSSGPLPWRQTVGTRRGSATSSSRIPPPCQPASSTRPTPTRFGGLVVVECKLWRNPQARREVVGQILDYAKELAAWDYSDLQREVSIARGERGVDALHRIVAARHPDIGQAAFVDAVSRNLARGRLMLLVAGDGIREGTEAIVQYVGRHAGLQLTFGLVEMAG